MKAINHSIEKHIVNDLERKMIFLSGPRQIGKTTLAKKIIKEKGGKYLIYDDIDDRKSILKQEFILEKYVCLDEFHKYERWKNFLKGIFDKHREKLRILITGSARLDLFQKAGDSLFGRYYLYNLHPLSIAELNGQDVILPVEIMEPHSPLDGIHDLLKLGGFPEPFLSSSENEHRRWSNQRRQILIREEIRDITNVQLLGVMENLMLLIPNKIGSLFSFTSLAEDLRISVPTIQNWMSIFEKLFIVFKVPPFSTNIKNTIHRQSKYYLWDWSQVSGESAKFENFIASHLYKAVTLWNDLGLANISLFFIRDRNGREVDFLLIKDEKPWFLVEVKLADEKISHSLRYFSQLLMIPAVQVIKQKNIFRREGTVIVISADSWLGHLV